jgi:hypothetical protein
MKKMLYGGTVGKGVVFLFLIGCQKLDRPSLPDRTPSANRAPSANAGGGLRILLPNNSVQLVGSGTDLDGRIVFYNWTKISGPLQYTLEDTSSAIAFAKNLVAGEYAFEFKVTDDGGLSAQDTAVVTVLATCPCAPDCDPYGDPCNPWDY